MYRSIKHQQQTPRLLLSVLSKSNFEDSERTYGALVSSSRLSFAQTPATMDGTEDPERQHALTEYKKKLIESREWESKLKALRLDIKTLQNNYDTSEDNIKALQSVGQIIGEVLKQLDEERCALPYDYTAAVLKPEKERGIC